ncbi:alpha/beta fold hydrolase [Merismopedia glauca]|uniref:Alpha/beta hydrolase n=1 Tax=Merismopedia glauca CCAP 1448/3 TaxID=1296344 RepID=A0A2T1C2U6_9CYAN|nr:alpha/beta hydrolase [Merismopedia glauca]PSB02467.1 alpha/beta hydrolase [Merismopedia glauca CCAP 1448/3]
MAIIDILGVPHTYDLTPSSSTASQPTLVFVHGWLLSRHYWRPLIDRLVADYQCLAYDLRGFGHSQADEIESQGCWSENSNKTNPLDIEFTEICASRYTPSAYARDVGILLKELKIERAWLVGHSLGGTIALWAAHQLPEQVEGVICLNAGGGIYLKEAFEKFRAAGQQILRYRPRWLCYLPAIDVLLSITNVARPVPRVWGRQRVIDFVMAQGEAAVRTLLDSTTEAEVNRLPQLVSSLEQPVYFIAGAQDKMMEPQYVHHLASFHALFETSGQNVIEISDCGHLSMVEQPEAVATQIRQIIRLHQVLET